MHGQGSRLQLVLPTGIDARKTRLQRGERVCCGVLTGIPNWLRVCRIRAPANRPSFCTDCSEQTSPGWLFDLARNRNHQNSWPHAAHGRPCIALAELPSGSNVDTTPNQSLSSCDDLFAAATSALGLGCDCEPSRAAVDRASAAERVWRWVFGLSRCR